MTKRDEVRLKYVRFSRGSMKRLNVKTCRLWRMKGKRKKRERKLVGKTERKRNVAREREGRKVHRFP